MWKGMVFFLDFSWKTSKKYVLYSFVGNLLGSLQLLGNIVMPKWVIDELADGKRLTVLISLMITICAFNMFCTMLASLFKHGGFAERIKVSNAFTEALVKKLSLADFEQIESADYLDLKRRAEHFIYGNMRGFGYVLDSAIIILCKIISFVGISTIIITLSPTVLFFFVLLVLLCSWVENWAESKYTDLHMELSAVERREIYLVDLFSEVSFAKEIRMGGLGEWLLNKLKEHHKRMEKTYEKGAKYRKVSGGITAFSTMLQQLLSYLYLYAQIFEGRISVGSFTMYVAAVSSFANSIRDIMSRIVEIKQFQPYYEAVESFLSIKENMRRGKAAVPQDLEYVLEMKDVCFVYPGQKDYAVKNINLTWKPGEKLSIVGENGSGKTTIIKLITRMYEPTSGEILLNGINIQELDYDAYMKLFSAVFQDFSLFAFSVYENIVLNANLNEELAMKVVNHSGVRSIVERLKNGLFTPVYKQFDNEGFEPSGGQAQQIALARALYKNTPFIVLDEPSSALDPKAEYGMYKLINESIGEKSAIYISHRLASCKFCDRIILLKKGQIVEEGKHEELLQSEGEYAQLFKLQANLYAKEKA